MDELDLGNTIKGFIPGQKVLNRYKLERILGRGGMGVVWLARDEELERDVALKFLPEIVALDPEAVADLKRETRRNLDLTHPHIVRIHDFVSDKRTAAIAMEYVDGSTLAALKLERPGRVFTMGELRPWVEQLLEALHYAHTKAKVVHRDLKPANLMITGAGDLKITDFGIAHSITDSVSRVSKQAGSSGTPVYMSPQQMMGEKTAVTDDIYAVGATLYELLTSKPPFYSGNVIMQVQNKAAPPIAERRAELGIEGEPVPSEWEEAIAACLAKDPAARPQSGKELAERLGLAAKANAQRPTSNAERSNVEKVERGPAVAGTRSKPVQGPGSTSISKTPLYAGVAAGALLLGGLGWYFGFHVPEQNRLAEIAQQRARERAASEAGEEMGTPAKKDDPSAAAKNAVAEYSGAAARGARFVGGIVRVFGEAAAVTSLTVNSQRGGIAFRAPGESAEIVIQRINRVIDKLNADPVVGFGSKSTLAAVDYVDEAGYHHGLLEVEFTSTKGQPAALAFADEGLAKYKKVTLTMEILALADGDIARDAGVPAAELVKANELGSNQQRFYQLEKETGVRLLDNRQLASEGVGIPFRVSLESSLANALKFMQALEAGPWRIRYKEYSIVVAAPQVAKANPSAKWTIADLKLDLMPIAPGTFQMGSASSAKGDERPVTRVTLTQPFWLGKTEVTQAQWQAVMGGNPSHFKGDNLPVERVSWNDAMEFCRKLTERERAAGRLPEGHVFTLPTEAQWEYACRAGTSSDYAGNVDAIAWYGDNSQSGTKPVGQKQANAWGLHDMHGNVWEWCADWYGVYLGGGVTDPSGPSSGSGRIFRGGSWGITVDACRSANRSGYGPDLRGPNLGFRLALAASSR